MQLCILATKQKNVSGSCSDQALLLVQPVMNFNITHTGFIWMLQYKNFDFFPNSPLLKDPHLFETPHCGVLPQTQQWLSKEASQGRKLPPESSI